MLSQLSFITLLVAHILTSSLHRYVVVVQQLSSLLVDAVVMAFPQHRLLMIYMIVIVIVRKVGEVEIFSG
jgi:hypothetical protein